MTEETEKPESAEPQTGQDAAETPMDDPAVQAAHQETGKSFAQLDAELGDLRDRLLRAVADADNTRKRAEKEVSETREYAVSRFAGDMLGVADNLARALDAARKTGEAETSEAMTTLIDGVEMTERVLLSALERHGVTKVEPAPGDAFDPHKHQAAAQIPSEQPSGTIAAMMQPGYVIGSRTLRAAMVAVSAGAPAGGQAGGQAGNDDKTPPEGGVDIKA